MPSLPFDTYFASLDINLLVLLATFYKKELEVPVCQQAPYGTITKEDLLPIF